MAIGSALLAIRAYLIEEWAFLILELAWFTTAFLGILISGSSVSTSMPEPLDVEIELKSSIDEQGKDLIHHEIENIQFGTRFCSFKQPIYHRLKRHVDERVMVESDS